MSFASPQRADIRVQQITQDYVRRKRESEAVSLRKQAREEHLQKRRLKSTQDENEVHDDALKKIQQYRQLIYSQDEQFQLEAVTGFQKLLSVENPPIKEIIESNSVTIILRFLDHHNEDIQYMSLWAITNIAAGKHDHAMYLYQENALEKIISLIKRSASPKIREQACWALGNLAGDCPDLRDKAIHAGAMMVVLDLLGENETRISVLKTATWTLSNLCRGRPPPEFEQVKDAIPVAARLIHSMDRDVEVDALWALAFLSEGTSANQEAVAVHDVCKRLTLLLQTNEIRLLVPSIRTIGNLMSGDDDTTQRVIDSGVLNVLAPLLSHNKAGIRKEACWTVSNVLAGRPSQIGLVVDAGLIEIILARLHDDRHDIQREAAWCIANAVSGAGSALVNNFVQTYNVVPEIIGFLIKNNDTRLIDSALDAVIRILKMGQRIALANGHDVNPYRTKVEECDGYHVLCDLQSHEDVDIYKKAKEILETFWNNAEEDADDESIVDYGWQ